MSKRTLSTVAAVVGMYIGGFLWEEVSPVAYSVVFLIIASSPLMLKTSFWKKILLLFPLLIIRVVGKVLIKLFGLKALERLFIRYGLLESRYRKMLTGLDVSRAKAGARWKRLSRRSKAHLILTFLPFLTLIALAVLIIKLLRFRLLQMVVEKLMQKGVQNKLHTAVETASMKLRKTTPAVDIVEDNTSDINSDINSDQPGDRSSDV